MINATHIFNSSQGTQERVTLELAPKNFPDSPLKGDVIAELHLLRIDKGIALTLTHLETTLDEICVRCGKKMEIPLKTEGGEWIYYQYERDHLEDPEDTLVLGEDYTLDPIEPLRQEIILHTPTHPRHAKLCQKYDDSEDRSIKSLAGLKDIVE